MEVKRVDQFPAGLADLLAGGERKRAAEAAVKTEAEQAERERKDRAWAKWWAGVRAACLSVVGDKLAFYVADDEAGQRRQWGDGPTEMRTYTAVVEVPGCVAFCFRLVNSQLRQGWVLEWGDTPFWVGPANLGVPPALRIASADMALAAARAEWLEQKKREADIPF